MKFLTEIVPQFFEMKEFPERSCTIRNSHESSVFDSSEEFECVLFNEIWNRCEIRILKPYIWVNNGRVEDAPLPIYYGWTDRGGNLYDHFEKTIHGDDAVVVGWRKIE